MPQLSIIAPSLNHEKYISEFIKSVLSQTFTDFELIIVDDCSTDKNVEIIKSFNDNRIKLIQNDYNMGINASFLKGVNISSSSICVFMSTDDIFDINFASEIMNIFKSNNNIDIVYSQLKLINEYSEFTNNILELPKSISREEMLKINFYKHHITYIPGMAMKKSFIEKYTSFSKGLLQYADLQLHIEALLYGKIYFLHKPLILYRLLSTSASARNRNTISREICETNLLMDTFLQIKDVDLIKSIFKDDIPDKYKNFDEDTIPFILGMLALNSPNIDRKKWGYDTIIKFYSKNNNSTLLYKKYGTEFKDIINYINPISSYCYIDEKDKKIAKLRKKRNIAIVISIVLFVLLIISLLF